MHHTVIKSGIIIKTSNNLVHSYAFSSTVLLYEFFVFVFMCLLLSLLQTLKTQYFAFYAEISSKWTSVIS